MNSIVPQVLQLALQGVSIGAVYSLVALGLVLTYKATEVLNFAHGDLLMASAFLGWWLIVPCGLSFWLAAALVVVAIAALSFMIEAGLMRRIAGQPQYAGVMLTIAIGFMLRGAVSLWLGPESRVYETPWTGRNVQMGIVTSTESRGGHRVIYMPPEAGMAHRSYLSPDRKHVVVAGEMTYYSWLPCRLVPYDGTSPGKLVGPVRSQCTEAAWSPDGVWMYFTANTGSGFHIWRQRFPDGTASQVTSGVTEEEGIGFAPDGRSFVTSVGTRQSTVWIHDSRGDRQVTSEGYGLLPTVSPDGRKLYYLMKAAAAGSFVSGSLWVADLETGRRHQLLPDFLMKHYDISADGERAVFVAAGDTEQSPVWVAALDGRSAPRRLVEKDGLQAFFSAVGEVTFGAKENGAHFLYRVKEDGSDLQKVSQIFNIYSVSPDGQWAMGWGPPNALVAYPLAGGSPRPICRSCVQAGTFESSPWASPVSWSRDGKFMYLQFNQSTYAIPLRPREVLPPIPDGGFRSEEEVSALPGASVSGPRGVFSGLNPSTYVFTKVATQRNIYRMPVP